MFGRKEPKDGFLQHQGQGCLKSPVHSVAWLCDFEGVATFLRVVPAFLSRTM